jgi:hypothetical protein
MVGRRDALREAPCGRARGAVSDADLSVMGGILGTVLESRRLPPAERKEAHSIPCPRDDSIGFL